MSSFWKIESVTNVIHCWGNDHMIKSYLQYFMMFWIKASILILAMLWFFKQTKHQPLHRSIYQMNNIILPCLPLFVLPMEQVVSLPQNIIHLKATWFDKFFQGLPSKETNKSSFWWENSNVYNKQASVKLFTLYKQGQSHD